MTTSIQEILKEFDEKFIILNSGQILIRGNFNTKPKENIKELIEGMLLK